MATAKKTTKKKVAKKPAKKTVKKTVKRAAKKAVKKTKKTAKKAASKKAKEATTKGKSAEKSSEKVSKKEAKAKRPSPKEIDPKDIRDEVDEAFEQEDAIVTDAEGNVLCRVRDCDQKAVVESFCRYHYLLLWKKIQMRNKILEGDKFNRYVSELVDRYPDKFLDIVRRDLSTEKDFFTALGEMGVADPLQEDANDDDFSDDSTSNDF